MASGSANFQETSAVVGDTIHANFTWSGAVSHSIAGYGAIYIADPSGGLAASAPVTSSNGSDSLNCVAGVTGNWRAYVQIWDGNSWETFEDFLPVAGQGAPSGSANFQETSAVVGDTIHANFTWINAIQGSSSIYAYLMIINPDGATKASWIEMENSTGSKTLSYTTDMSGTWNAEIQIWTGINWLVYPDTLYVGLSEDVILTEAVTCDWVNDFEDHGPTVTEFDLTDWVWAYLQVHSDAGLYGKVMRREWWFKETSQSSFTKRSESTKTCTRHYTNWATWPTEDMGSQYGSGEGHVRVYVDNIYLGKTNNYNITGGLPNIKIEPSSEFFTGPFIEGTMQTVCNVHVKNYGGVAASAQVELWEYPNSSSQKRLASRTTPEIAPETEMSVVPFEVDIPIDIISWSLGIKVWGTGETEPSF